MPAPTGTVIAIRESLNGPVRYEASLSAVARAIAATDPERPDQVGAAITAILGVGDLRALVAVTHALAVANAADAGEVAA